LNKTKPNLLRIDLCFYFLEKENTRLEKEHPKKIKNYYFDGIIKEDELASDYKLKNGASQSWNALKLRRKVWTKL